MPSFRIRRQGGARFAAGSSPAQVCSETRSTRYGVSIACPRMPWYGSLSWMCSRESRTIRRSWVVGPVFAVCA